jgi:hypothetical protein
MFTPAQLKLASQADLGGGGVQQSESVHDPGQALVAKFITLAQPVGHTY